MLTTICRTGFRTQFQPNHQHSTIISSLVTSRNYDSNKIDGNNQKKKFAKNSTKKLFFFQKNLKSSLKLKSFGNFSKKNFFSNSLKILISSKAAKSQKNLVGLKLFVVNFKLISSVSRAILVQARWLSSLVYHKRILFC